MSSHFVYRPHVRSGGKVYTPDLVIDLAWASYGQGKVVALPVDRLTTATAIQQPGGKPHGIAAIALVGAGEGPLLTVASLHSASFYAPALLACAKPLSRQAWRLRDVAPHLNRLRLRSWHLTGDERRAGDGRNAAGRIANFDRSQTTCRPIASCSSPPARQGAPTARRTASRWNWKTRCAARR